MHIKGNDSVSSVRVWGIEESMIASGYPMQSGRPFVDSYQNRLKRAIKLGNTDAGSGHDCFLKGITVQFDWRISQVIFLQVERYHFIDIVSSQSKMHRLHLAKREDFNGYVDSKILNRFMDLLQTYNAMKDVWDTEHKREQFLKLVYSCPMGYELTARFTTNYLQLKTIFKQRKNHKLKEWRDLCEWMVHELPFFSEFTQTE